MITAVTGLTRSGTSLMMRMLHVGGVNVYAENLASYETSEIFEDPEARHWPALAEGRAIKLLEPIYLQLPKDHEYRFILMTRDPREQAKSMVKFLIACGAVITGPPRAAIRKIEASIREDIPKTREYLDSFDADIIEIKFENLIREPKETAELIAMFCGGLNADVMAAQVVKRNSDCLSGLMEYAQIDALVAP